MWKVDTVGFSDQLDVGEGCMERGQRDPRMMRFLDGMNGICKTQKGNEERSRKVREAELMSCGLNGHDNGTSVEQRVRGDDDG